jgi:putative ABC transport system ATP-binding protein
LKDVIVLQDVRKVYRVGSEKVVALDNVTLNIAKGECCCFLGTSGSGKSTLLNLMAGLEKPTRGSITIQFQLLSSASFFLSACDLLR